MAVRIRLPHNFTPRDYQLPKWRAFDSGYKRLLSIGHRRAGKDVCDLNLLIRETQRRVGTYYYFLPTFQQARKVIWEGINIDGYRLLDHVPYELRVGEPNNTQMLIRMRNGSIFQLIGSDTIDSIMGTNPVGCVFSEFSLEDPAGWDYMSPILRVNGGWALFNGTPRGKNHMFTLRNMAVDNPEWWVETLTVDDTGVLSPADIQKERDAGRSEAFIQQEYFCSFEGSLEGSYYGSYVDAARADGRITKVPHNPSLLVHTAWDQGQDGTDILFFQLPKGGTINIIDEYHDRFGDLARHVRVLRDRKEQYDYVYGEHIAGWEVASGNYDTGESREERASKLSVKFKPAPRLSLEDGIAAVQAAWPMLVIDEKRCEHMIDAAAAYRRRQNKQTGDWLAQPVHNWASHPMDALRHLVTGRSKRTIQSPEGRDRYAQGRKKRRKTSWMAA